jgi:dGTPase
MLAPYAFPVEASRGRRSPEPAHPYRNDFQRDRDRIIHCRAFRRLENKTQVFTTRYSDHFRNRLTHTIEVAQIARTVGGALGLNTDLCEALALAHDIGHPPFGHAGEKCLDAVMARFGEGFDHNLHALHIVEKFEQRYAAFPGLNLTFEVREGVIKHSRDYAAGTAPELDEYLLEKRPPLEAQLIDLVDEIAYNTADLDDGCEAGLLEIDQIRAEVPLFQRMYALAESLYPAAAPKLKFNEALKRVLDALASDLIGQSRASLERERIASVDDVRQHPARLAAFSPPMAAECAELKQFLYRRLYDHPVLVAERDRGVGMLEELFDLYLAKPGCLPRSYQALARTQPRHRVVCDYIAGMTDGFFERQHRELVHRKDTKSTKGTKTSRSL